ncbi:MAG: leucine-rich repeat domain-containing protein [Blautia sp.]|nr:leucine-rich repeat domain-containing protein [Blautia sp.]
MSNVYSYEEITDGEIRITGYEGEEKTAEVPVLLDGRPVTQIGSYAFSGTPIRSLSLPPGIVRMGRYALYNCADLEELSFYGGLKDIGAGAFTGCHHIRIIRLTLSEDETSALRDVLMEVSEELEVEYRHGDEKAVLLFPEFYEEGVENTPARIIEHHTHGSGMFYRNCFENRRLKFHEYDSRFPYAIGQESEALLLRLVTARLRYPYMLAPSHRETYLSYLDDHFSDALDLFTRVSDQSAIGFLMSLHAGQKRSARPDFDL